MRLGSRAGVVDVGTNSVHLVIGARRPGGRIRVLRHERELVFLGEGGLVDNRLRPAAVRRALRALRRCAGILDKEHVRRVAAVATSAVREAVNGPAFVRKVRRVTGLPLRVISGQDEARLAFLGIQQARGPRRSRRAAALIAIGGGSAQVAVGQGTVVRYCASAPLGASRLAQRFLYHDPVRGDELRRLARHITRSIAPLARGLRHRRLEALGGSGLIAQVLAAASRLGRRRLSTSARGAVRRRLPANPALTRAELSRLVAWLAPSTAAQRRRLPGLDPARQALALPTALVLLIWMEQAGAARIRYAPGSIREGVLAGLLSPAEKAYNKRSVR